MDIKTYLQKQQEYIESILDAHIPKNNVPQVISDAIRYSLLNGGKRVRPILVIAAAEAVGGSKEKVAPFAAAVEMIHVYTLIHDDLPAIDNDEMRRGKPANHKKFGEAMAILSGDGLLTLAFETASDSKHAREFDIDPIKLIDIINTLAKSVGIAGTIGGQVVDILCEGKDTDKSEVEYIHKNKTASLMSACVKMGASICSCDKDKINQLKLYGDSIGLAFQIIDDILDIAGDEKLIGKDLKSDLRMKKATYPSVFGMEESRRITSDLLNTALNALRNFDNKADPLRGLANFIIKREY